MNLFAKHIGLLLSLSLALSACSREQLFDGEYIEPAQVTDSTRSGRILENLPAPSEKIAVAVYDFQDQTGQFKYNDRISDYSSAVTKGGLAVLNNALLAAGRKSWFTVVERNGLKNLLQERQIIRTMREQYRLPDGSQLPDLPPLLYSGMLLEGGIVAYDSNVLTGGLGAKYLGIGAHSQYRSDMVTVYLRAINIQTGEVLLSVTGTKTIYSSAISANVFKFLEYNKLLEAETGVTFNEPPQLAVRQAVETALYSLIMEGAKEGVWSFADASAGARAIADYDARKDGVDPHAAAEKEARLEGARRPLSEQAPAAAPMPAAPPPVAPVQAAPPPPAPATPKPEASAAPVVPEQSAPAAQNTAKAPVDTTPAAPVATAAPVQPVYATQAQAPARDYVAPAAIAPADLAPAAGPTTPSATSATTHTLPTYSTPTYVEPSERSSSSERSANARELMRYLDGSRYSDRRRSAYPVPSYSAPSAPAQ